jgi:hypothetical protein
LSWLGFDKNSGGREKLQNLLKDADLPEKAYCFTAMVYCELLKKVIDQFESDNSLRPKENGTNGVSTYLAFGGRPNLIWEKYLEKRTEPTLEKKLENFLGGRFGVLFPGDQFYAELYHKRPLKQNILGVPNGQGSINVGAGYKGAEEIKTFFRNRFYISRNGKNSVLELKEMKFRQKNEYITNNTYHDIYAKFEIVPSKDSESSENKNFEGLKFPKKEGLFLKSSFFTDVFGDDEFKEIYARKGSEAEVLGEVEGLWLIIGKYYKEENEEEHAVWHWPVIVHFCKNPQGGDNEDNF